MDSDPINADVAKRLQDLRYAVDQACIVAVTDARGYIIFVNHNFCKISGFAPGELIGQRHSLLKSGYHPEDFYKRLWDTIIQGEVFRTEFKNKAKNGSFYWTDTTIVPFLNETKKPFQYISISRDISQLKASQELLIEWKNRYEAASEVSGSLLYDWDRVTQNIVWAGQSMNVLGYSSVEMPENTKQWLELIHPQDRMLYSEEISRVIVDKTFFHLEYRICKRDGSYSYIKDNGRFYLNSAGEAVRMVGFISDISVRKRMENTIRELPQRMIEVQEKEKERIALDIHDDLGQSLIGTKMLITSYMKEPDFINPVVQQFSKEVLEQIDYCIEKARQVSYGLVPPQLKLLGLTEAVKFMITKLNYEKKLLIDFKVCGIRSIDLQGREINVYRVIQEALNNIFKHANATEVQITMDVRKGKLSVMIKDNGQGFDKRNIQKKKQTLNRGLGLFVMQERAKILNGKIRIESKPGQGTLVKLIIPAKEVNSE